jgi:Family of unknown function (DUF5681)
MKVLDMGAGGGYSTELMAREAWSTVKIRRYRRAGKDAVRGAAENAGRQEHREPGAAIRRTNTVAMTKRDQSTPPAGELAPANRSGTGAKRGKGRPFKPGESGNPGTRFVPGQSGNPSGRPKDVLGIQRYSREFGPEAIDKLVELMRKAASESAQATAAVAILDRGCGKPTQPAEGRLDVTYLVRDEPMPMDEWRKRFAE